MAQLLKTALSKAKSRSRLDLVHKTVSALERLAAGDHPERAQAELAKDLHTMKVFMFGEDGLEPNRDHAVSLAYEAVKFNLPLAVARALGALEFESRKDAAQVVGAIIRLDNGGDHPGVAYVREHPDLLTTLFQGYSNPDVALNCGAILRDCFRDESLAQMALESPMMEGFFEKVELTNFEVASDAFATFKDLLTRHKAVVAQFLAVRFDDFFARYTRLLQSENYVTRRQSLKLLGELLLDRANLRVMMRYVSEVDNLKLMMLLLKDSSRSIQFEAFHVFKVFVANPNKSQAVVDILVGNRDKLVKYLSDFHTDKDSEDEQFREEKAVIIRQIAALAPEPPAPMAPLGSADGSGAPF